MDAGDSFSRGVGRTGESARTVFTFPPPSPPSCATVLFGCERHQPAEEQTRHDPMKEPEADGDSCHDAICFEPEAGVARP
jgi:hypothetical protein